MKEMEKFESLLVILFLLPGFAGLLFYSAIAESKKLENLDKIILALALTLLSHVLYGVATGGKIFIEPLFSTADREEALREFASSIGWTTGISIVLGIIWAVVWNHSLLFRVATALKMTHRTGAIDVWHQVFARDKASWVRIRFKDEVLLDGWAMFYSEDSDPMQLFLAEAKWHLPRKDIDDENADKHHGAWALLSSLAGMRSSAGSAQATAPHPGYHTLIVDGPGVLLTDFSDVRAIERLTGDAPER